MQDYFTAKVPCGDRFIPPRSYSKASRSSAVQIEDPSNCYNQLISREILSQPSSANEYLRNSMLALKGAQVQAKPLKKNIQSLPLKILDAPNIKDDYYLNLLDWSSRGLLSIGLGDQVFLYSDDQTGELCSKPDDYICSLAFHPKGQHLSVSLSSGKIEIYDVLTQKIVRTLRGHTDRVSSSSFTYDMLFTGSKDKKIIGHDLRCSDNVAKKFIGHRGEVCGLKHDSCGLASGSNDNQALIWDINTGKIRYQLLGHKAAVKALAWCPWQKNLLATGGGTSDKTMRFWNIETGKLINVVNTESQVCSLVWNPNDREILSSHGYSQNQLSLWKYPECQKTAELKGHSQRVLHMSLGPDEMTVCTASADQTLRFWKIFDVKGKGGGDEKKEWKLHPKFCQLR